MRHPAFAIAAALFAVTALFGCSKSNVPGPGDTTQDRTISVRGYVEDAVTKASLDGIEGTLNYVVRFAVGDPLNVYIRQGDKLVYVSGVTVQDAGADGELCYFDLVIPEEIDLSQTMTIFGFTAPSGGSLVEQEGRVLFDHATFGAEEAAYRAPLSFRRENYLHSDDATLDLKFAHFGAYLVSHFTNSSGKDYTLGTDIWDQDGDYFGAFPSEYDYTNNVWWYQLPDIETGELVRTGMSLYTEYGSLAVPAGGKGTLITSVIPAPGYDTFGFLQYKVNHWDESGNQYEVFSNRYTGQFDKKIVKGRAYHVYLDFDGSRLTLTDAAGVEKENPALFTFVTEKPLTELFEMNASATYGFETFIDLNGDGVKQEGEALNTNQYTLQKNETSLYGMLQYLEIRGQSLTKALFGPNAYIASVYLENNLLSAAALDELYDSLPTVTGMTASGNYSSDGAFHLFIKGNPGVYDSKLSNAEDKGWVLDISKEYPTGVTLDAETKGLAIGDTYQLTATLQPEDTRYRKVTWTSSNPAVATVSSEGLVTAVAKGAATITVTTVTGGFTAKCKVTVGTKVIDDVIGEEL